MEGRVLIGEPPIIPGGSHLPGSFLGSRAEAFTYLGGYPKACLRVSQVARGAQSADLDSHGGGKRPPSPLEQKTSSKAPSPPVLQVGLGLGLSPSTLTAPGAEVVLFAVICDAPRMLWGTDPCPWPLPPSHSCNPSSSLFSPTGNLRSYNLAAPNLPAPSLTPPQLAPPNLQQFFPQATRQSLLGPPPVGVPMNPSQLNLSGRNPQKQARTSSSTTPNRKVSGGWGGAGMREGVPGDPPSSTSSGSPWPLGRSHPSLCLSLLICKMGSPGRS